MLELEIDHLGAGGDGVATAEGKAWYVPFTAPGDRVQAEPGEKRGRGQTATLTAITQPAPIRQQPACRHFGTCGGCSLQHIDGDWLADWKRQRLEEALTRAEVVFPPINPTVSSPPRSRRRVEFVAAKRKKGVMIGYHLRRSHQIFDVGECPLIDADLLALVKPLRAMLPTVMPRNSQARLTLTRTLNGTDLLITANLDLDLGVRETLASFAADHDLSRISLYHETDKLLEVVAARKPAAIPLGSGQVNIPPGAFLQATREGEQALTDLMLDHLPEKQDVVDLFSGCGSFSLPAAPHCKSLHAIEGDAALTEALQSGANKSRINLTSETRDLFRRPLMAEELNAYDVVIIDPPRAGADAQCEQIAGSGVKKVIFISCNPASFARDAKTLQDGGYRIETLTPVDQFLWSSHVELFATFIRK
ncbi:class I SAM-dependent RNA methyltransferase [Sneathiella chinensis]|uniref:RNA methyltransferase n=1 Tax=Sneathiella chinensis TaxID=349750 RepID=A0ABQ5U5A7_9PROT|nr:class I SAM-dependent RNA methyltransferase [Sneathiella chinensis]GLQ06370.1 RNA methyltransferase [Sneathiella chinensis]